MMINTKIEVIHFGDRSGHKPRNTDGLYKLKMARNRILPLEPPEGDIPTNTLTLAQRN